MHRPARNLLFCFDSIHTIVDTESLLEERDSLSLVDMMARNDCEEVKEQRGTRIS